MKFKFLTLACFSLFLTACQVSGEFHVSCTNSTSETETTESCSGGLSGEISTKSTIDINSFNPNNLELDFSQSNVSLLPNQNAYINVT